MFGFSIKQQNDLTDQIEVIIIELKLTISSKTSVYVYIIRMFVKLSFVATDALLSPLNIIVYCMQITRGNISAMCIVFCLYVKQSCSCECNPNVGPNSTSLIGFYPLKINWLDKSF